MRIRNLALERYGPFTGHSLSFRPDARLHIVFGPNEAGKSSSLAAIADLFFKIEPRTQYDFLHKTKDMRIGAIIEAHNGRQLSFQRRKGNKDTLLDSSDMPLPDDSLLPFIGNLTRDVFTHAFGLNTETLRQGAEEMLKSGGEIGASLFAAASGMKGMTDLRQSLEREADGIFAPRAAKERKFYQILDRNEIARRAIRDLELKAGDWKELNDEIENYAEKLKEIAERRAKNSTERTQLSRLRRVAPLMRLIDADLAELAAIGILPEVTTAFTQHLRAEIDVNKQSATERERALEDQDNAERELSSVTVDEMLLVNSDEIQFLFAKTGAYEKDQRDIPRIQAEADGYSAELNELAVRLGMPDAEQVQMNQPADTLIVATRSLISEGKKLAAKLDGCSAGISAESDTLAGLEEQRTTREAVPNPRHLRDELATLGPVLKQLDRRDEIERTLLAEARNIKGAAARLHPPVADLSIVARASLPSVETIARFRTEFDRIDTDIRWADEQATAIADTIADIERGFQAFATHSIVPSSEAITTERQERDKTWSRLRDSMIGTTPTLVGAALTETILAFEQHSAEADRLVDCAVANAGSVASYAADLKRLNEEKTKQNSAKERQTELCSNRETVLSNWVELWAPAGFAPLPPLEMVSWLSQVQALVGRLEKNDALNDDIKRIDTAVLAILPALEGLAGDAGIPRVEGLDAKHLVQQIQNRLSTIERIWEDASRLETSIANTQTRIDKLRKEESEAARQTEAWKMRWGAVLPTLGLPAITTIEEADAALSAWQKVPDILRERDNRQRRVAGMLRDSQDFESRVKIVAESSAPDLLSLSFEAAIKRLNERLGEAANAKARHDQVAKRLEKISRTLETADKKLEKSKAELELLTASVPPDTDLLELLERFSRREEINNSLSDHRDQLLSQGEGSTEEQLRAELTDFHVDEAGAKLQQLVEEDARLESEARETFANRKVSMNRHSELQKGMGAEVANQQKKNAEAELVAATREWLIVRLGALLIGHAIDKSRATQHSPLIKRAGELFSTITGGSFVSIGQDFGEDDTPYLVGRRSTNEIVPVSGLSEGARDQLFLALRLAYLEDFAKNAEPVPFIGDDLFTSFDEDRTANGLLALAAIGQHIQPILFTHHRHVVDIARSRIGEAADVIEMKQFLGVMPGVSNS